MNSEATTKSCSHTLVRSRNGSGLSAVVQLETHIISKSRCSTLSLRRKSPVQSSHSMPMQVESSSQHPLLRKVCNYVHVASYREGDCMISYPVLYIVFACQKWRGRVNHPFFNTAGILGHTISSLVPRPFPRPAFDRLQYVYCKRSNAGSLGTRLHHQHLTVYYYAQLNLYTFLHLVNAGALLQIMRHSKASCSYTS